MISVNNNINDDNPSALPVVPVKPTSRARAYRIPKTSEHAQGNHQNVAVDNIDKNAANTNDSFLWATREIAALDFLMNVSTRKSVVFLISDFLDHDYWKPLKLVNKKHDLIGIRISDPAEQKIPNLGLLKIIDPESNEECWVDTSSKKEREFSEKSIIDRWNNFNIESKKNKFDVVNVSTSQDYVEPLMRFFKKRERRS